MPTVNVGKRMREEAYVVQGRKRVSLNVSKDAVVEYADRIDAAFDGNMEVLCRIALSHGRKTVLERDVVEFFSRKDAYVEGGD